MCPHQSLWALFSDWFCIQGPARCHHFHQPTATQVNNAHITHLCHLCCTTFASCQYELNTYSCSSVPKFYFIFIFFLHVLFVLSICILCFFCMIYLFKCIWVVEHAAVSFLSSKCIYMHTRKREDRLFLISDG